MSCINPAITPSVKCATTGLPSTASTVTTGRDVLQNLIDYLRNTLLAHYDEPGFDPAGHLGSLLVQAMDAQKGRIGGNESSTAHPQPDGDDPQHAVARAEIRLEQARAGIEDAGSDGWRIEYKNGRAGAVYVGLRRGSGKHRQYRHIGTVKSAKG